MTGRVLVVAGSDSGGGAGLQADIKTITALGGYAASAVTAVTAQNTLGVFGVVEIGADFVARQMEVVLTDIGADAIKTGMLGSEHVVRAVARACARFAPSVPLIVDPVMVAKDGTLLLDAGARAALIAELVPRAALLTPNAPEAESLTGARVRSVGDLSGAADRLLALGASAVLIKGGHLEGDTVVDLLRTADGVEERFESPRLTTKATHGTGCTLASAVAAGVAEGWTLSDAVRRAHDFVFAAMRSAPGLGAGHGPLDHAGAPRPRNGKS
jgi:hydroxymethylpyrimidine/phosphomethylpyrimidine kinase